MIRHAHLWSGGDGEDMTGSIVTNLYHPYSDKYGTILNVYSKHPLEYQPGSNYTVYHVVGKKGHNHFMDHGAYHDIVMMQKVAHDMRNGAIILGTIMVVVSISCVLVGCAFVIFRKTSAMRTVRTTAVVTQRQYDPVPLVAAVVTSPLHDKDGGSYEACDNQVIELETRSPMHDAINVIV